MEPAIQSQYAQSFKGRLYALATNQRVPLRLSRSDDKFSWGFTPEEDWLQAGGNQPTPTLHFRFDSHTDTRLYYEISRPGRPTPKKLGRSRNGYLGFYQVAEVTDLWKIEPLEQTADGLICYVRDHEGFKVSAIRDTPHRSGQAVYLLNTQEGDVITFLLQKVG